MRLAEPFWLILLVLVPMPWLFARARPRIAWPSLAGFERVRGTWASRLRFLPVMFRMVAIALLAVAMARPQTVGGVTRVAGQGVAIVAVLDHSTSMTAEDFPSDHGPIARLAAAKQTFAQFVEGRPDDLVGLVVFANFPSLACAPTLDHEFLVETVRTLRPARPGDDGTNLGDAIAWALGALRETRPAKKVLILLTDGRNEPAVSNPLDPKKAAELAQEMGVKLYTIAVGGLGGLGGVVKQKEEVTGLNVPAEIAGPDFALLEQVAKLGGGRAFVAADANALSRVFKTIDALERSPVRGQVRTRYDERYGPWVASALVLLALDRLLAAGRLRRLP